MRYVTFLLAATSLLGIATAATAADMDEPVLVEAPAEYQPVEVGSGWYLRGDISYAVGASIDGVTYRTFDPLTSTYDSASFDTADIDNGFGGSIGFGYRFTDYLRADFTADILKSDFDGTTSAALPCPGAPAGTTCRSEDTSSFYTSSYLINGYIDLGTYSGFTPYVGAGAGVSRVKWDGLTNTLYCVDDVAACAGATPTTAEHASASDWRFTYALMAGVAYDVTTAVKLDVGYRFKHVDGGDMFGWDPASRAAGASGVQGTDDGYDLHEVKVGFRYELW